MAGSRDIGYDALAAALSDERSTKDVVGLKRGFLGEVQKSLGEARAAVKKAEARDGDSAEAEMARQNLKMLRTKVRHILNLRVEKLFRLAVHDAETGTTAAVDKMLEDEIRFYTAVNALARLSAARLQALTSLEGEDRIQALEKDATQALGGLLPGLHSEPEGEQDDLVTVHILSDVEEFVWKGGRKLKPRKGDVMNVPRGLADVLLGNGTAERAE